MISDAPKRSFFFVFGVLLLHRFHYYSFVCLFVCHLFVWVLLLLLLLQFFFSLNAEFFLHSSPIIIIFLPFPFVPTYHPSSVVESASLEREQTTPTPPTTTTRGGDRIRFQDAKRKTKRKKERKKESVLNGTRRTENRINDDDDDDIFFFFFYPIELSAKIQRDEENHLTQHHQNERDQDKQQGHQKECDTNESSGGRTTGAPVQSWSRV